MDKGSENYQNLGHSEKQYSNYNFQNEIFQLDSASRMNMSFIGQTPNLLNNNNQPSYILSQSPQFPYKYAQSKGLTSYKNNQSPFSGFQMESIDQEQQNNKKQFQQEKQSSSQNSNKNSIESQKPKNKSIAYINKKQKQHKMQKEKQNQNQSEFISSQFSNQDIVQSQENIFEDFSQELQNNLKNSQKTPNNEINVSNMQKYTEFPQESNQFSFDQSFKQKISLNQPDNSNQKIIQLILINKEYHAKQQQNILESLNEILYDIKIFKKLKDTIIPLAKKVNLMKEYKDLSQDSEINSSDCSFIQSPLQQPSNEYLNLNQLKRKLQRQQELNSEKEDYSCNNENEPYSEDQPQLRKKIH